MNTTMKSLFKNLVLSGAVIALTTLPSAAQNPAKGKPGGNQAGAAPTAGKDQRPGPGIGQGEGQGAAGNANAAGNPGANNGVNPFMNNMNQMNMANGMQAGSMTPKQLAMAAQQIINNYDQNGDGQLNAFEMAPFLMFLATQQNMQRALMAGAMNNGQMNGNLGANQGPNNGNQADQGKDAAAKQAPTAAKAGEKGKPAAGRGKGPGN